jgi:putative ABC transport system substrate-binding protein
MVMRARSRSVVATALTILTILLAGAAADVGSAGSSVPVVGLMHVGTDHNPPSLGTLVTRLGELGWFDGSADPVMQDLVGDQTKVTTDGVIRMSQLSGEYKGSKIDLIWRNLDADHAPAQAQEFANEHVDVIVAFEDTSIRAAKAATSTPGNRIPVVFLHPSDPVRDDLVKSLSNPGGNLTGVFGARDPVAKQLQIYQELMPHLKRLLTLIDPTDPTTPRLLAIARKTAAALPHPVKLVTRKASDDAGINRIFRSLRKGQVNGVFILSPQLRLYHSATTIALAAKAHLPVQAHRKEWVQQQPAALFSLGVDLRPVGREGARYVDSILRGTPPSQLPVEEVPKVELAINLQTAKRLGIKVSHALLIHADEVYP